MKRRITGFTLLELLMVLGVLGVLMGLLIPSVGVVREQAQRMATGQKLRQIGLAVATYHQTTGRALTATDMADWIARLASETGVREGRLFLFEEDPLMVDITKALPPALVERAADGSWRAITGFAEWPIGITVVSGLHPLSPPATTPVAWTRGLQADGSWRAAGSPNSGIYGDQGGFIVFLDGHVEFHRDLSSDGGRLLTYERGEPTHDISRAINPGAKILSYYGSGL